jgi:hypothetical protein
LTIDISRERRMLDIRLEHGRPMKVYAGDSSYRLERGRPLVVPLPVEGRE